MSQFKLNQKYELEYTIQDIYVSAELETFTPDKLDRLIHRDKMIATFKSENCRFKLGQLHGCCGTVVLFNLESYRSNLGFGTLALEDAIKIAKLAGYSQVVLTVGTSKPMKRIIEKIGGFEEAETYQNKFRTGNNVTLYYYNINPKVQDGIVLKRKESLKTRFKKRLVAWINSF